jgi:endonuclease/exonuclease/phosphatase family metal-dependent hydrolase
MKLINVNLRCGIAYEPTMAFIKKMSSDIDIFCFQEVFHDATVIRSVLKGARPNLFSEIQELTPDFAGYYAAPLERDVGGLAMFIRKSFVVDAADNIVIFDESNVGMDENDKDYFAMGRNLQRVEFNYLGKTYTIFNFHGMWIPGSKTDTEKRIEQSERVRKQFDGSRGAKILCADLNVTPDAKSVAILTEGNRDLIKEYGITSTRSLLKNRPEVVDYMIVSPEVIVAYFEVLKDEVSDHAPLLLEFE